MVRRSVDEEVSALVVALRARPDHWFRAAELKQLTGVPKSRVRGLLSGVNGVMIEEREHAYWFTAVSETSSPLSMEET